VKDKDLSGSGLQLVVLHLLQASQVIHSLESADVNQMDADVGSPIDQSLFQMRPQAAG
jgi:hypothetical protein